MPDSALRVRLRVDSDARLVRGVAAAAGFLARQCNLSKEAVRDLKAATEGAVRDTLPLLSETGGPLDVCLEGFEDRVEIILEHHGEALPSAGLDTFLNAGAMDASAGGAFSGLALLNLVDRVLYNTTNGTSRTTLVKYRK